uniref:Sushi domain-containing protein n=1 Tax=Knipowitschia caucasica TaxID=637954 RepID=A0AAV2J7Q4_KNICA
MEFFIHWTWFVAFFCILEKGDVVWCTCSMNSTHFKGGNFTLSNGLNDGSILQYQCKNGFYPYPELSYRCQLNHRWTPEPKSKPRCNLVECPDPTVLKNGYTLPIHENRSAHVWQMGSGMGQIQFVNMILEIVSTLVSPLVV